MGVDRGLAMFKFSTSPRMFGLLEIIMVITPIIQISGVRSLIVNEGWNFILSICALVPVGLEDPFTCKAIRCTKAIAEMSIGTRKCREKNRLSVG